MGAALTTAANGLALLQFEWNDRKERATVQKTIAQYIRKPPLCTTTALEASSQPFDARGMEGWEASNVCKMSESVCHFCVC